MRHYLKKESSKYQALKASPPKSPSSALLHDRLLDVCDVNSE